MTVSPGTKPTQGAITGLDDLQQLLGASNTRPDLALIRQATAEAPDRSAKPSTPKPPTQTPTTKLTPIPADTGAGEGRDLSSRAHNYKGTVNFNLKLTPETIEFIRYASDESGLPHGDIVAFMLRQYEEAIAGRPVKPIDQAREHKYPRNR